MEFLKNLRTASILKLAGLVLVALLIITAAMSLLRPVFSGIARQESVGWSAASLSRPGGAAVPQSVGMKGGYEADGMELSARNVAAYYESLPIMPPQMPTTGDQAEEFEVTDYSATIETRRREQACGLIADLKQRPEVIFESANDYDHGCNYRFKVRQGSVAEVLDIVRGLNPRDLNENTYTIKSQVDDFTSEEEILQNKLASIDETLAKALAAYDDVAALATSVRDVESLAKIIDSRLNLIQRLSQERLNIASQLERISRAKSEQLDRLEYAYFYVNVYENKFVDGDSFKDSWRQAVQAFFRDLNRILQDLTINLITLIFLIVQYAIYLFLVLVVAKYLWRLAQDFWRR